MRALCPACGCHHEVARVLDEGYGEARADVYQIEPLESCTRTWLSDKDLLEACARFGVEAIVADETDE
jgi:hypothetical protein